MLADSFLFSDEKETNSFGVVFDVKTRLTKYIHKKTDAFLYWSIDVKKTLNESESNPFGIKAYSALCDMGCIVTAESGIYDYTKDGTFFQLTEEQKQRALVKRIAGVAQG